MLKQYLLKSYYINILRLLLFLVFAFTIGSFAYVITQGDYDKRYYALASELRVLTEQIVKRINQVTTVPTDETFDMLIARRDEFSRILYILKNGQQENGKVILPKSPDYIQEGALQTVISYWNDFNTAITFILIHRDEIQPAIQLNHILQTDIKELNTLYSEIASELAKNNASADTILAIVQQVTNATFISSYIRIALDVNILGTEAERALPGLVAGLVDNGNKIKANSSNIPALKDKLDRVDAILTILKEKVDYIVTVGTVLDELDRIIIETAGKDLKFLSATTELANEYLAIPDTLLINSTVATTFAIISFLLLIGLGLVVYYQQKANAVLSEEINKKIQDDIHQLLGEISGLASGNLTIHASTKGELTKEIAEAINYAIGALKQLITQINSASKEVSQTTQNAQDITKAVSAISEKQSEKIIEASKNLDAMIELSEKVFLEASSSASVAAQSLNIAQEGGKVVRNTIVGMDRIENQIQQTSEKIVKLGESSEEINEIISLIQTISEQTNILSINAAIQAAIAGEEGRGFAVIADEIQKLAVKASVSTTEIEQIIKSIQKDTQDVIHAMATTRTEVGLGSDSANLAGRTLEKIEQVSKDLSEHITLISQSSDKQKRMSTIVTEKMKEVKELSSLNAAKATATESLIESLAKLISELRSSVFKFKLPS